MAIYDFTANTNAGVPQSLGDYRGKVLLIVNVASRCGFTPQYKGLQALQETYGPKGFDVLAFPCDQFGHQEPGTDAEIASFCDTSYSITFPLFSKINVNGKDAHPLYVWLKDQKGGLLIDAIKWNFTKFLVGKDGTVIRRYPPTATPESIEKDIAAALG
jgi:glutathione peroxidase